MQSTDSLSLAFGALADPTRRDILNRLGQGPVTVGTLAGHYAMSRPAISQHLGVLERAGLIARDQQAQWRECSVRNDGLDGVSEWISLHRTEWNERLDALEERIRQNRTETRS